MMFTGSYNPQKYNGFKIIIDKQLFFRGGIYTVGDVVFSSDMPILDDTISTDINPKKQYLNYFTNEFKNLNLSKYSFVFEYENGVVGAVLGDILNKLNVNLKIMYEEPDGTFLNHHLNSSAVASFSSEISEDIFFNDKYFGYHYAIYSILNDWELVPNGFNDDTEYEKLPQIFSTDELNINNTKDRKFEIIDNLKEKLSTPLHDFPCIENIITVDEERVVFENDLGSIRARNNATKLVNIFEAKDEKTA